VLAELGRPGAGLTVLLTDDEEIRRLNREFRGVDRPTNVLAFPDTGAALGASGHLGDVAVSTETVVREAGALGSPVGEHFLYYLIHAVLHLFGHDHELGPEEDEAQRRETDRLMALIRRDI
jgi:probable rRNA maturation factor